MGNGLVEARLETLSHGRALNSVNEAIAEALADIHARRNIEKPRKVTVQIDVIPKRDAETGRLMPQFKVNVGVTTPKMPFTDEALVREDDGQAMVSSAIQEELLASTPDNVTRINSETKAGAQ